MNVEAINNGSRFLNEMLTYCRTSTLAFRVHYWDWRQLHYSNHVHKHSFYEVCYVMTGEGEYQDEDTVYDLHAGTLFVSRPGVWHQIRSETGMCLIYVAYELDQLGSREEEYVRYGENLETGDVVFKDALDDRAIHYWLGLYHHASTQPYHEIEDLRTMAGLLLASLVRPLGYERDVSEPNPAKPTDSTRYAVLRQSKQYIRDNLSRPLKIEEVAEYMNLSTRQLSRLFQLDGGDTFLTYLRNERLKHAEMMLKTSIFPLKEIAAHSGFQSVHYFTNVFTERMGIPPGEYRRVHLD
ncbi:AraC family transcriptional regulator, L-rhamnose operon transcriptional activator RhaR [Paenibacillus catalpae]|uniref:AraC family transcriptional regulator, L-rhamnose operon transcriptional activator RhaR n=1 Tax=Paenibacillus catalpae TaxID=1045775 RepID=A0A1I1VDE9_9BACL|nr:AraC family transcriptional regulator [Paenibacillus catalpae]SFD80899.1 AraC family transcriptional regulator, L-rhamnose operon transcriptional activator RhaR [Paenibacillus catalpae]